MKKSTHTLGSGVRLACLERPGGEVPLVLLHGISDNALTWAPVLDGIDARCRVIAPDLRGHGESDKPEARYDAEAYADDVRRLIEEVVGEPALVLGHSLGAVVGVQIGATAPGLVRGLCLEDPPLYFVNDLNDLYRGLFEGIVMMARTMQDGSRSADDWFEVMANAPDPFTGKPGIESLSEADIRLRVESIAMMRPQALEDALAGSLEWDTDRTLRALTCPVTMINGDPALGAVITPEEALRVAGIIPYARTVQLAGVGHLVHDEQPQAWLAAVNAWIAEQLAPA
jgi:pimeloyl-ACP methyl ester carboxylesterase